MVLLPEGLDTQALDSEAFYYLEPPPSPLRSPLLVIS